MSVQRSWSLYLQCFYILIGVLVFVEGMLGSFERPVFFKSLELWTYITMAVIGFLVVLVTSLFIVKELKIKE